MMPTRHGGDLADHPQPTCSPSEVVDMIIPWPKVSGGDLILHEGQFRLVERIGVWMDSPGCLPGYFAVTLDDGSRFRVHEDLYAAVRRYAEG